VLLAVAILQGFGVGGLELAGAEIAGPTSERLAPRVAATARRLWTVYVLLTLAVMVGLLAVGVGVYDALAHALTTIPTAGFSTYNASIGQFDSAAVEAVLILGMLAGGTNFALQFRAYTRGPRRLLEAPEFRTYLSVFAVGVTAVTLVNLSDGMTALTALRESAFNVATTLTTCGYGTSDFTTWLPSAQLLLLMFMFVGGMTGSTSGGIKMLRFRIVLGHLWRDIRQARQPRGVYWVRLGRAVVAEDTVARIGAWVTLYLVTILTGTLLLTLFGEDLITALSGVISDVGLVGPALGEAGPHSNFLVYSEPSQVVLIFMMFLGRMELYVALLMFSAPARALRRATSQRRPGQQPAKEG
jgi:trk system potassium uptake protein TrkH